MDVSPKKGEEQSRSQPTSSSRSSQLAKDALHSCSALVQPRLPKVWGIGLDMDDPRVHDPAQWQDSNILGKVLMRARKA